MKTEKRTVQNPVAKFSHRMYKNKTEENKLKKIAKGACRGQKPSSLFWLI